MTSVMVFGIGLPKTGTTSLARALQILGYNPCPNTGVIRSNTMFGDFALPAGFDSCVNVHEHTYPGLDDYYPGSKFILTVRKMPSWLTSVERHFRMARLLEIERNYAAGRSYAARMTLARSQAFNIGVYNEHVLRATYEAHYNQARRYFSRRSEDFLIINICNGEGWSKLCSFLGKEKPDRPFPCENKATG